MVPRLVQARVCFVFRFLSVKGVGIGVYEFLHQVIDYNEDGLCDVVHIIDLLTSCTPHAHFTAIRAVLGFDSCFPCGSFSWSSHTSHFKIGTPVATLPGTWCYRISVGTGRPGIGTL